MEKKEFTEFISSRGVLGGNGGLDGDAVEFFPCSGADLETASTALSFSESGPLIGMGGADIPFSDETYFSMQEDVLSRYFSLSEAFSWFQAYRDPGTDAFGYSLASLSWNALGNAPPDAHLCCWLYESGNIYRGEIDHNTGSRHGYGQYTDAVNGWIYDGIFQNGFPHGYGTLFMVNGDVYQGMFKRGDLDGRGVYVAADKTHYLDEMGNQEKPFSSFSRGGERRAVLRGNPQKKTQIDLPDEMFLQALKGWCYEGIFKHNLCHGVGSIRYQFNGSVIDGTWCGGELESSNVKITFCDSSVYEGTVKGLLPCGVGSLRYANGSVYTGEFKRGKQSGKGTYTDVTNTICTGNFVDDQLHGHGLMEFANGMTYDGNFEHGVPCGYGKCYWKDGHQPKQQILQEKDESSLGSSVPPDISENSTENPTFDIRIVNGNFHSSINYAGQTVQGSVTLLYYEGQFLNGKSHGKGRSRELLKFDSEQEMDIPCYMIDEYDGQWCYGVKCGDGKLSRSDGSVFTGSFVNNCPTSLGTWVFPSRKEGTMNRGFQAFGKDRHTSEFSGAHSKAANDETNEDNMKNMVGQAATTEGEEEDEEDVLRRYLAGNEGDETNRPPVSRRGSQVTCASDDRTNSDSVYSDLHPSAVLQSGACDWYLGSYASLGTTNIGGNSKKSLSLVDFFAEFLKEGRQEKEDGSIYIGQLLDAPGGSDAAIPHGSGTLSYPDGSVYKGTFVLGKPHGSGKCKNLTCTTLHPPYFHLAFHQNGEQRYTYSGEWNNGVPHGYGTLTVFPDEDIVYQGEFVNGYQHGEGSVFNPYDQCSYQGVFINNRWCGFGIRILPDGTRRRWKGPILTEATTIRSPQTDNLPSQELNLLDIASLLRTE